MVEFGKKLDQQGVRERTVKNTAAGGGGGVTPVPIVASISATSFMDSA